MPFSFYGPTGWEKLDISSQISMEHMDLLLVLPTVPVDGDPRRQKRISVAALGETLVVAEGLGREKARLVLIILCSVDPPSEYFGWDKRKARNTTPIAAYSEHASDTFRVKVYLYIAVGAHEEWIFHSSSKAIKLNFTNYLCLSIPM